MNQKNKTLNLMTSLGGDTLGVIGINLLKQFKKNNIDVSLFPIPVAEKLYFNNQDEYDTSIGAIRYSRNFDYKAPTLKIWHPHDLAVKPGGGKYFVLIVPYSNSLTASEVHHLNFTDGIFCHSDEVIEVLRKHKIKPKIHKIDLGVDTDIFTTTQSNKSNDDPYIFYGLGKWSLVNGHDIILRCFNETFDENDNVLLRLLPHNEFLTEEEETKWFKLIDDAKLKNKITIYNKLNNQYELANFIADSDCFLSLGRIAHSGLSVLEAISMGKPIIYTDIGTNTQYNVPNNTPIIMKNKQAAYDNRLLFGESDWFSFEDEQIESIKNAMRYNFTNKIRSNNFSDDFIDKYTWANTAKSIIYTMFMSKTKQTKTKA